MNFSKLIKQYFKLGEEIRSEIESDTISDNTEFMLECRYTNGVENVWEKLSEPISDFSKIAECKLYLEKMLPFNEYRIMKRTVDNWNQCVTIT